MLRLLLFLVTTAQGSSESWVQQSWRVDDGLPQSSVTDIAPSDDGRLWLGTFGGLVRFDGIAFEVFDLASYPELPSLRVVSLATGEDGTLWVGLEHGGVYRFDGQHFEATPGTQVLDDAIVWDLTVDGATVYAGTDAGLARLDPTGWTLRTEVGGVRDVAVDGDRVWAAGSTGLLLVEGDTTRVFFEQTGDSEVTAVVPHPHGGVIAASPGEVVHVTVDGIARSTTWGSTILLFDDGGRLWTEWDGVVQCRGSVDQVFAGVDLGASLHFDLDTGVRTLFSSGPDSLWVGTDGRGLFRLTREHFERLPLTAEGVGGTVVMELPDGRLVASAGCEGLSVRDGDRFVHLDLSEPLGCVTALWADEDDTWWAGDEEGVVRVRSGETTRFTTPEQVAAIHRDTSGTLRLGTLGAGLLVLDAEEPGGALHPEEGGPASRVLVIDEDAQGRLWIGASDGLWTFDLAGWTHLDERDGLPAGPVRALLLDANGSTWVGTYGGGLAWLHDGKVDRFTRADGLHDNVISTIADDGEGHLWLNGNRGAFLVHRSSLVDRALGGRDPLLCRAFQSGEGNGGGSPASWLDDRDALWLPTIDGIVRFDLAEYATADPPPQVLVTEILLDGRPITDDIASGAPVAAGTLVVRFATTLYRNPDLVRFQYRLPTIDPAWRDGGTSRELRIPQLAGGPFELDLRAVNEDGVVSSEPTTIRLDVARRWRDHPLLPVLLSVLISVLAIGLIFLIDRLLLRAERRRTRELQRLIEQRKAAEASARRSEAHYRELFETVTDGLLVVGDTIEDANPAAARLLAVSSPEELIGEQLESFLVSPDGEARATLADGARSFTLRRRDDTKLEALRSIRSLGDGRWIMALVDVTSLREAERERAELRERVVQLERLEALGRLAGSVAHDFNNMLAVVQANAQFLGHKLEGDEDAEDLVEDLVLCAERGARLTGQLLTFGRRQQLDPEHISVTDTVARSEEMLRRTVPDDIRLALEVGAPGSAVVHVDPTQLEMAVLNLVMNAAEATSGSGRITLSVTEDAQTVHLSVADEGHGIPDDVLPHIFEPFYTTRDRGKGTGLGLASVHGFVGQADGTIDVHTTPEQGTEFTIHLPRSRGKPRVVRRSGKKASLAEDSIVLVVDDEPQVRRALVRMLTDAGAKVVEATSALDAVKIGAEAGRVDLLVTDVLMPDLNGPEVATRLRKRRPSLPVVYVSGYTDTVLEERVGVPEGVLLHKPFTAETLQSAVSTALGDDEDDTP